MRDHFVLLVDQLLTESTLEAAIRSKSQLQQASPSVPECVTTSISFHVMDAGLGSSPGKLGECRICHDEDAESNMEVPCSCRGSLKYAHRKCVQRWCNEKGDTNCEICLQLFKPGYTAPPPLFHYGGIPMNFRGNWEISRRDIQNLQFISMDSTNGDFLDSDVDDYPAPTSRSVICCRIIAMIFVVLVVLRHTLPFMIYGAGEYSISAVMLLTLRTIGVLLPVYIMVKALSAIQRRRNPQDPTIFPVSTSDQAQLSLQAHVVQLP
ncbi:RING/FYVE/PHD zinc finger superfamily protein [Perilla frutescens var. hirtella]|uniref:RING/FYVE/PHD zinc finger superfamily protein n=1 Tax=Perilla frutescens var. hirtella TaxID=608512 RepID=A0AAD4ILK6_PERFH|nr:RING/FYVE/PHD zinc finger superfamily protein [Perilla frutescens var. hirtella]KAH6759950.1 RING/FYVE/PHD zinc finger superfamily protein [Perilla frutescens var. frutescens]KAH6784662.1 RING/FYVE/PHD zinc finger superfamily protein [Perilla frutescens var. hirtella]